MRREKLRQVRVEAGFNQIQAAEQLDINVEHVRSLEYGRVNPSPKLMFRICSFYNRPPEELFPDITNGILNTTIE